MELVPGPESSKACTAHTSNNLPLDISPLLTGAEMLKGAAQGIAPIVGWLYSQNQILENYYVFSPKGEPLGNFLTATFYRAKGVEFEPTKKLDSIVPYLDPYSLGIIAGATQKSFLENTPLNINEIKAKLRENAVLLRNVAVQEAKYEVVTELVKSALLVFDELQIEISVVLERGKKISSSVQSVVSEINSISDGAIGSASEEVRRLYRENSNRYGHLKKKRIQKSDSLSEREKKKQYNKLISSLRENAENSKQELRRRAIGETDHDTQERYRQLSCQLQELRREKRSIPWQVYSLRKNAFIRIRESWRDRGYDEELVESSIPIDGAYRYLDGYLQSFLETQNTKEVLEGGLSDFLSSLSEVIAEENKAYPSRLVTGSLGFILARRVHSPEDLQKYFEGIWAVASDFQSQNPKNGRAVSQSRYESTVMNIYSRSRLSSPVPPVASTKFIEFRFGKEIIQYPDCGETAARNIINLFLYDPVSQEYDVGVLKRSSLMANHNLISFYEKYSSVATTSSQEAHSAWGDVITAMKKGRSNNEKIDFLLPRSAPSCEMRPGGDNLLKAFKCLLGTDKIKMIVDELNAASGKSIAVDLSQFDPFDTSRAELDNKIIFDCGSVQVDVICNYRHYRIFERRTERSSQQSLLHQLDKLSAEFGYDRAVEALQLELQRWPLGNVLASELPNLSELELDQLSKNREHASELANGPRMRSLSPSETVSLLLSSRADWVNDIENLSWLGLHCKSVLDDPGACSFLSNILLSIPRINGYDASRDAVADFIEHKRIHSLSSVVNLLRKKSS